LSAELKSEATTESLAVEATIDVGIFVTRVHVGPRVRIGSLDTPAPQVNPQLIRESLDGNILERPQIDRREIEQRSASWIEIVDLDSVVDDPDSLEVSVDCDEFRRGKPAGPE
jgi:hypothetical protein